MKPWMTEITAPTLPLHEYHILVEVQPHPNKHGLFKTERCRLKVVSSNSWTRKRFQSSNVENKTV